MAKQITSKPKKPSIVEKSRRANATIQKRIMFLALLFGIVTFAALFVKLWKIQIIDHQFYEEKAIANQTRDLTVSANRGMITDSKGAPLAISATVHNVVLSPKDISEKNLDPGLIANGLSDILGIDANDVLNRIKLKTRQYEVIATKVEEEKTTEIRKFIKDNKLTGGIYLEADSKRYYPRSSMAAQVVGFINSENNGSYGVEAVYNSELAGKKGQIVTSRTARGTEMLSNYEAYVDAENGNNLTLTIDSTIQGYAQQVLQEGIEKFEVIEGGFCVVMNPKTGAILAMVSMPDYDLNNFGVIKDPILLANLSNLKTKSDQTQTALATAQANDSTTQARLAELEQEAETAKKAYNEAVGAAQLKQWRNKALTDAYEPGSTFKPIVLAMALEEGKITKDTTYYCPGFQMVPGWEKPINCSVRAPGHGTQDTEKALMNSCNPAMIQIGQKITSETFYEYMGSFGLMSKTGIDLQGEEDGFFWPEAEFNSNLVSLATASFGQRFEVTPVQMVTAISAVVNGGYLLEPYVVQSVSDSDGNVLKTHDTKVVRQVISKETSDLVRNMMGSVVNKKGGTGKNAHVDGYSIGGKTGTSQFKLETGHLITSFVGIAPVEDPEIVVLLAFDHPKPASAGAGKTAGGTLISGGNMAAPMAGPLIADILEHIGVKKEGDQANSSKAVPTLKGKSLEEAKNLLKQQGLKYKVVGKSGTVTDQTPLSGVAIPAGSTVVLYLGSEKSTKKVVVPDLSGSTYSEAKKALESRGLYMKSTSTNSEDRVIAFSQSMDAGTQVNPGTVIEVGFMDNKVKDYGN